MHQFKQDHRVILQSIPSYVSTDTQLMAKTYTMCLYSDLYL